MSSQSMDNRPDPGSPDGQLNNASAPKKAPHFSRGDCLVLKDQSTVDILNISMGEPKIVHVLQSKPDGSKIFGKVELAKLVALDAQHIKATGNGEGMEIPNPGWGDLGPGYKMELKPGKIWVVVNDKEAVPRELNHNGEAIVLDVDERENEKIRFKLIIFLADRSTPLVQQIEVSERNTDALGRAIVGEFNKTYLEGLAKQIEKIHATKGAAPDKPLKSTS